jgi:hypothetical protein
MPSFLKEFWSAGKAEYVTFLLQRLFADVDFHCQHVHSCLHTLKSRNCVSRLPASMCSHSRSYSTLSVEERPLEPYQEQHIW